MVRRLRLQFSTYSLFLVCLPPQYSSKSILYHVTAKYHFWQYSYFPCLVWANCSSLYDANHNDRRPGYQSLLLLGRRCRLKEERANTPHPAPSLSATCQPQHPVLVHSHISSTLPSYMIRFAEKASRICATALMVCMGELVPQRCPPGHSQSTTRTHALTPQLRLHLHFRSCQSVLCLSLAVGDNFRRDCKRCSHVI